MFAGFEGVWSLGVAGSRSLFGCGRWHGPDGWLDEVSRSMRHLACRTLPAVVLLGDASGVDACADIVTRTWFPDAARSIFGVVPGYGPAARTRAMVAALAACPEPVLLACPWNTSSPGTWLAVRCAVAAEVPVVLSPAPGARPYLYSSPPLSRSLFA